MQKLCITALMLLTLAGCSSTVTPPPPHATTADTARAITAPPGLWYAEKEEPDQFKYHVYVLFLDEHRFQWWRTKEDQATVLKRMDYYVNEHPGSQEKTLFTRTGNQLTGERRIVTPQSADMRANTFVQTFHGRFEGDRLELTHENFTIYNDVMPAPTAVFTWSLKRLGPEPGK